MERNGQSVLLLVPVPVLNLVSLLSDHVFSFPFLPSAGTIALPLEATCCRRLLAAAAKKLMTGELLAL